MRRPLTASLLLNTPVCLSIACILMTLSPANAEDAQKTANILASARPAAEFNLPSAQPSVVRAFDSVPAAAPFITTLSRTQKPLADISFIYACGASKRAIASLLVQPRPSQATIPSTDTKRLNLYDHPAPTVITVIVNANTDFEVCASYTPASDAQASYADTTPVYEKLVDAIKEMLTVEVNDALPASESASSDADKPFVAASGDAANPITNESFLTQNLAPVIDDKPTSVDTTPALAQTNIEPDAAITQFATSPTPVSNIPIIMEESVDTADSNAQDDTTPVDEELAAAMEDMARVNADPAFLALETASPDADRLVAVVSADSTHGATEPVLAKDEVSTINESQAPVAADGALTETVMNPDSAIALIEASLAPTIPVVMNRSVEMFIKYFQTRGRKHFVKWLSRSPAYMSMLQGILRENGLPVDISYIAFIESGLNPKAKSRAKAVGMWQFIKGTGKKFGLRIDWWIDERMDPEKATLAAAKYFKNLYGEFDSWYLAAAGYNAGEGRVRSAVRKHGTTDFWQLALHKRPLRRETREYVPKYLAAMLIAKDPLGYGFDASELDIIAVSVYDKVNIPEPTDLHVIAEAAGTTAEELQRLNPELLRWYTPPNYPDYMIKIPLGSKGQFVENFAKILPQERLVYHTHTIKRGDTLSTIAKRYGTDIKAIVKLNSLKSVKHLKIGETLAIPVPPELGERKKIRAAQPKGHNA